MVPLKQKGFSLLEVVLSLLLFTIFLQGFSLFYTSVLKNSSRLQQEAQARNEARVLRNYIEEQIRVAEQVKLILENGQSSSIEEAMEGTLKTIEVTIEGKQGKIKYLSDGEVVYEAEGAVNPIAFEVNELKVSKAEGSQLICFEYEIKNLYRECFTETIAYK